jgi:enoyl-CoA hydratase
MPDLVQLERQSGGLILLTFNRPEARNALNWEAMFALRDAVTELESEQRLTAVIVTGAGGRAFISGGDLRDLHTASTEDDALRQHDLMAGTLDRLAALPVPVIAAIEGATRGGGCEVAVVCDLRFASSEATFAFAQIDMAVTPGWGGAERLVSLIGYSRAFDLLVTGRTLEAQEGQQIGLIDRIVEPGSTITAAFSFAERIAGKPALAIRGIKDVLHGYRTMTDEAARARERLTFARLWVTSDHAEASAAFLEKRPPRFNGS